MTHFFPRRAIPPDFDAFARAPGRSGPPGSVVCHFPASTGQYVGSPSLALLPDGTYIATHDLFGPGTDEFNTGVTLVYRSEDRGATWRSIARIEPAFWSGLFVHRGALYLLGPSHHHGLLLIRRSDDGGHTWTTPSDATNGLLTPEGQYHSAPMPMLHHAGRLWRAIEDAASGHAWGERYNPLLISAPDDADLLRRESWTFTPVLRQSSAWLGGRFGGWLEGNAVLTPDGRVANLLRVALPCGDKAALTHLDDSAGILRFDPARDFVDLPGGATKFTVRQDSRTGAYWTLTNLVSPAHADPLNATHIRNTLALLRSDDLRRWEPVRTLLHHPDARRHGFQYVDWHFEGEDIVALSRTACGDSEGGARRAHDANHLTFHRIPGFRRSGARPTPAPVSTATPVATPAAATI